ncbi:MAG: hypothetical protein BM562_04830 [Alphaproteobacteria bacterium MedPE-SWcel]|nr:MAG: hypothetical protein BM562_04830 [Alphaproteobacteria bacterium MedPE-SWcel]
MLVFMPQSLAFLAVPKTGSTALQLALSPHADIVFKKSQKHISARRFHRRVRPFVRDTFGIELESFALLRNPEDHLRSWYKYRRRREIRDKPEFVGDRSFDEFVNAALAEDPPPYARIGTQYSMLSGRGGRILVDHLFAYEQWDRMEAFLAERFQQRISCLPQNVSPFVTAELTPQTRARLHDARRAEVDLHRRLMDAGGKLTPRRRQGPL